MTADEFKEYLMKKYTPKMTKNILVLSLGTIVTFISFLIWFIWKTKVSLFAGCIGIAILLIGASQYFYVKHLIKAEINKFNA